MPTQPPVTTPPDTNAIRELVRQCAAFFVDGDQATTIANQVAANYEHWCRHRELCVLLEGPDTGVVAVQGANWDVDWMPANEQCTEFDAILPPVRVAKVHRALNGEWAWSIRTLSGVRP